MEMPVNTEHRTVSRFKVPGGSAECGFRSKPNTIDAELRRKGVTFELLWIEYKREHPDGYYRDVKLESRSLEEGEAPMTTRSIRAP